MVNMYFDLGCANGRDKVQSEFIKEVIALAEKYGEVEFSSKDVGVWGHDHEDRWTCEALSLTIKSMRDSS